MKLKVQIVPYTLLFKRPAGTSRGVYNEHKIWYIILSSVDDPSQWGIGECAPLFDLSCDYNFNYEDTLRTFCKEIENTGILDKEKLRPYPSIFFGLETAFKHLENGNFQLFSSDFSKGLSGIPINGLIWMGSEEYMLEQIEAKLEQGFRCIKMKIGAIDFQSELKLLKYIRQHFPPEKVTLRVDANGAFSTDDALYKLEQLAELNIHSIEQPIKACQWDEMAQLTKQTPLAIALDEELIGVNDQDKKRDLLETIRPQFIILKPTLHGGIVGCEEWIDIANDLGIDWWITSALESNVGLNAIAQWSATFNSDLPQGLGTGSLYVNNVEMPLEIKGDCLWYNPQGKFIDIHSLI